jgi:ABC-2 type transport system permease protein
MSGVVAAVIRREYLQRVRSKWFVFATVAGPVFMLGLILVPALMASRSEQVGQTMAVLDRTGVLYPYLAPRLEVAGYTLEEADTNEAASEAALEARVLSDELGSYLVLDAETLGRGHAVLRSGDRVSLVRTYMLQQAVTQSALEARLSETGAEGVGALLAGGDLEVELLSGKTSENDESAFFVAYMGAFLLYMVILLYAVAIMRSVLEEKTNRVVEVILASMRPFHLMLGKILGVGAVGLTQLAIWVAAGALLISMGIPALLAARPELTELSEMSAVMPGLGHAALFLVFFLGGYFMYSGLYAAVGAMCNTDEEAQQAQFPVILLLVVPVIFVAQVIQEPDSTFAVVMSLVPLFSPILMFGRAAAGSVPFWQLGLSIVLMALTVLAVAWVAGRIYKVGILMAGKRPTLPELVRWVREA